jgi:hypothetical protein
MPLYSRTLPPGFIAPCLPTSAPQPPCGALWLHEIKHDGIARKAGERVKLYSRPGNDLSSLDRDNNPPLPRVKFLPDDRGMIARRVGVGPGFASFKFLLVRRVRGKRDRRSGWQHRCGLSHQEGLRRLHRSVQAQILGGWHHPFQRTFGIC